MATAPALPHVAGYAIEASANLSDPRTRARLSPASLKAFLRIMDLWSVKDSDARQLLGGVSSGSYYGLKHAAKRRVLDQDTLTRISLLVGIFKALNILYSKSLADAWIALPNDNPMFRGASPLTYILQRGQPGMLAVRQLVDSRRGGQ